MTRGPASIAVHQLVLQLKPIADRYEQALARLNRIAEEVRFANPENERWFADKVWEVVHRLRKNPSGPLPPTFEELELTARELAAMTEPHELAKAGGRR